MLECDPQKRNLNNFLIIVFLNYKANNKIRQNSIQVIKFD
jgi:hypothetical protein